MFVQQNLGQTVEECPALDIRKVSRLRLHQNTPTSWVFYRDHEKVGSITVTMTEDERIVLDYEYAPSERIVQTISIVSTRCEFGGSRPWFLCPDCTRRVAVLYCKSHFRCRTCSDLSYRSQRLHALERGIRETSQRRRKLGGTGSLLEEFPPRPKRMRSKTYLQLRRDDARECLEYLTAITARLDKSSTKKDSEN